MEGRAIKKRVVARSRKKWGEETNMYREQKKKKGYIYKAQRNEE